MADFNISNMSYTEKDFLTIYPALLDLVKKLSYRWDPSISDESDPGVVLLKLNALVADKCNYNIDKNILETFPVSVTQEVNARNLFEQLGYTMSWYKAATTNISIRWIGDEVGESYYITIPEFTMVCDIDNKTVFTLTTPASVTLSKNVEPVSVLAIQGICKDYSVNGLTLINISNLDLNNRLYFDDYNVALNGIFISNSNIVSVLGQGYSWDTWQRVDNLYLETVSDISYKFKFGIDVRKNSCYIEFPENIEELIGDGIYIKYIVTDGFNGNTASNVIEKFYEDVKVLDPTSDTGESTITLTQDNIYLYNMNTAIDGKDPESIDSAYRNFQKISGTFDTLITLRDYLNAIKRLDLVSNGFACDRTNDILNSYNILSLVSGINQKELIVENNNLTNLPSLTAFDLKLYLLQDSPYIFDAESYDLSFSLVHPESGIIQAVKNALSDYQCISHDYVNLDLNKICFLKNKYTIGVKIIPKYLLSDLQILEVKANVLSLLYSILNSKNIDFGDAVAYDNIYEIIQTSDDRIKSISLDDIIYKTYAVYIDSNNEIKEEEISLDDVQIQSWNPSDSILDSFRKEIFAKSVLAGNTLLLNPDTEFNYSISQDYENIYTNVSLISTQVTITPTGDGNLLSYTLKPNEYLYFASPNLITKNKFGALVKYEFKLNNSIKANTDYELKENESIIFYYKANQDDTLYTYNYLAPGTVINSTINIDSSESSTSYIYTPPNILLNSSDYVPSNYTEQVKSYLSNVLATMDSIEEKQVNQTNLSPSYKFYWITNNIQNNYCILFTEGEQTYTLKSGEFFIYTNDNNTDFIILGDGTNISRKSNLAVPEYKEWKLPVLSTSQQENVINGTYLNIEWFKDSNTAITVQQTRYTQISSGYTVTFELGENTTNIFNDSTNIITYISKNLSAGVSVSYINEETGDQGTLEEIDSSKYNWSLQSRLDISTTSNKSQTLLENQKIILTYEDLDSIQLAELLNVSFLSSIDLELVGGLNIQTGVSSLLFYGDKIYPNIYTFNQSIVSGTTNFTLTTDYIIVDSFTGEVPSISYNLPEGTYLLSLNITGSEGNQITIQTGNCLIKSLLDSSSTSYVNTYTIPSNIIGKYDFSLLITSNLTNCTLQISSTAPEENKNQILVSIPFKYTISSSESSFDEILEEIKYLDKNNIFDFSYIVPEEQLIKNPLKSESFLDYNHIFNKFTICLMETKDIVKGITIFNGVR